MSEEFLIGGFTSTMKKGLIAGYGIYVTNKRIIGIKARKRYVVGAIIGTILGGPAFGESLGRALTKDESRKLIEELDKKKDFEAYKEDISYIELKKPSFWRRGHLLVAMKSGESIKVLVDEKGDYERLLTLLREFYPEALRLVG